MASQDWFEKDFYSVLGVPTDATQDAIKKAYRKLARKHHPDANAGDGKAEHKFKEVGEAYAVLSDPEQRQQYDAIRQMSRGGARFTAGGPGGAGGAGFEDVFTNLFGGAPGAGRGGARVRYGTGGPGGAGGMGGPGGGAGGAGPSLEDLLGGLFAGQGGAGAPQSGAGGMGTGFRSARGPRKGEDLLADTNLTFKQALEGSMLTLRVEDPHDGVRTVNARIPAGVRDGQKVRIRGKGGPGDPGGEPGDVVVTVHVPRHPLFEIVGHDVRITVPVTFAEATLGAQIDVPTPDGSSVRVRVPAGTPSGRTLRVKGRGVKTPKVTGDLLVTAQVAVPQKLDGKAKDALEAFAVATAGEDPRAELNRRLREGA